MSWVANSELDAVVDQKVAMPTVHYISRETLRKHGIDPLQWELLLNDKKRRVTTTNDAFATNVKTEVLDGTIRMNDDMGPAPDGGVRQPPFKSTGMDDDNNDAEDNTSNISSSSTSKLNDVQPVQQSRYRKEVIIQQMDNLQENERIKPSKPKVDKKRDFFDRVDELKVYKEKHGHLNIRQKEDLSLYGFCNNLRGTQRAIITGKGTIHYSLDDSRIAALNAIGFDWKLGARGSDIFFDRVEELKAYKEKHGHFNVRQKQNQSLYNFCHNVRQARKGKRNYRLDETRIAALDAIGFNWNPQGLKMSSTLPCAMSTSSLQATIPKINIGDVGYQFRKEFDSGLYKGTVIEILQDAIGGLDRRCVYEDGDYEDLTLNELKRLATLSLQENLGTIEVVGDVGMSEEGCGKCLKVEKFFDLVERNGEL